MYKSIFVFSLLSFLFFILGCKKELPFPDQSAGDSFVVNSLISPDSPLEVYVGKSYSLNDTIYDDNYVGNAQVVLKDEMGTAITEFTHEQQGLYTSNPVTIEPATTYTLEVKQAGQLKASATNKVPKAIECNYIGHKESFFNANVAWEFEVEIVDHPDEENYYILEGYIDIASIGHGDGVSEVNGYVEPHFGHYTNDPNADNATILSGTDFEVYPLRGVYLTDKEFNGQTYRASFGLHDYDLTNPDADGITAHIFVKSVSKEMYEYHISLEKYRLTIGNIFAQPEIIPSNINDGLGLFGGYTMQSFELDLPKSEYIYPTEVFAVNEGCSSPCEVHFSSDGGARLIYFWEFGDGATSSLPNPSHTYTSPGAYQVNVSMWTVPGETSGWGFTLMIN